MMLRLYWQLFWSFCQIGAFSFGGGYAALPLIQNQVVEGRGWLSMMEFADIITISQMTPGPIAINAATFVGIRVAGVAGAVIATLGCVTPSCIIVLTLGYFYFKYQNLTIVEGVLSGLRPAVVALIASAGLSILKLTIWGTAEVFTLGSVEWLSVGIFFLCFLVLRRWKPNPILIIFLAGIGAFAVEWFGAALAR